MSSKASHRAKKTAARAPAHQAAATPTGASGDGLVIPGLAARAKPGPTPPAQPGTPSTHAGDDGLGAEGELAAEPDRAGPPTEPAGPPDADPLPKFAAPEAEVTAMRKKWQDGVSDEMWAKATRTLASWTFARTLTARQMQHITTGQLKNKKVPTPEEVDTREKAAHQAAAEQAKADQATSKRAADVATWNTTRDKILSGLEERITKEAPGADAVAIRSLVATVDDKVQSIADINVSKQIHALEKEITTAIKTRQIELAKADYPHLRDETWTRLRDEALALVGSGIDDFRKAADHARAAQRSMSDLDDEAAAREWARLLDLKLYGENPGLPFGALSTHGGFSTHYSVDTSGIAVPRAVPDNLTAQAALQHLFGQGEKFKRLHVALETGSKSSKGEHKLPHRYWAVKGHELRFSDATHGAGCLRWDSASHTEAEIKAALDAAYTELETTLTARMTVVLEADCNPDP